MRLRKSCSLLLALFLSCVISFSVVSPVEASALSLPSGGHFLTANETLSFIGNSLTVTYYNGSDYVDTTANYYNSVSVDFQEVSENPVGYVAGNHLWLCYSFSASPYASPDYLTFKLNPQYSIFDTEYLYTAFALCRTGGVSTAVYDPPASDWYIGGTSYHFENNNESAAGSGVRSYIDGGFNYNTSCAYIPIMHTQNNRFSAYSLDAKFNGFSGSGTWYFWVMCPYVSDQASGASGTFTTASGSGGAGGGDVNVNVDIDMDETNDLLSDIKDGISGIGDTILGLFVPDDDFMEDWVDSMKDLLEDHLGGLYEAIASLDDFWNQFSNVTAKEEIYIPECHIPLAGSDFVLGNWHVPLKPTGIPQILYTSLALIIDFLAIMSFLKMCRNKLEIFLNPDSEVVESDH